MPGAHHFIFLNNFLFVSVQIQCGLRCALNITEDQSAYIHIKREVISLNNLNLNLKKKIQSKNTTISASASPTMIVLLNGRFFVCSPWLTHTTKRRKHTKIISSSIIVAIKIKPRWDHHVMFESLRSVNALHFFCSKCFYFLCVFNSEWKHYSFT